MKQPSLAASRLGSLDILRGLDLFFLLFLQPVLVSVLQAVDQPWVRAIMYHFDHERWVGFRLWDLVMPLFLFMVGTSMPFSFAKYRNPGVPKGNVYKKILRRFLLLFLFGMIVQGNLLAFDPSKLMIYNNTLQAIAVGYVIAALVILNCRVPVQILVCVLLMAIYWVPMAVNGDYSPEGNFAFAVDREVIGRFRGDLEYTWIWSSLTFGATVLLGALAGQVIRSSRGTRSAAVLSLAGVGLIGVGLLASAAGMPIIKKLWTSSMTLYSAGWCFLLLGVFHYIVDCRGWSRGLVSLMIYGMNPITAYVLGEVVDFRSIVRSVSYGLEPILGDFYPAWLTFGNFLILFLILRCMYRREVFLKI